MSNSQTLATQSGTSHVSATNAADRQSKDTPNYETEAFRRMKGPVKRARDVYEGSDKLIKECATYLPQWELEEAKAYAQRVLGAPPTDFFGRAVRAFAGLILSQEPELGDDVPATIKADWENIDLQGNHGAVFAKHVLEDGLTTGINGILVDFPYIDEATKARMTRADEMAMELRPYWCHYVAEDIVQVRYVVERGRLIMSRLVLHELEQEDDGEFGEKFNNVWRVYRRGVDDATGAALVTHQLYREVSTRGRTRLVPDAVETLGNAQVIPFALMLYGPKLSATETRPPLLSVVDKSLQHWRNDSDLQYVLSKAARPTLIIAGANKDAKEGEVVQIGPDIAIYVGKDGRVEWLEFSGQSAERLTKQKESIEKEIASLALAFLQRDTQSTETATGRRIDNAAQSASLASAATTLEDGLEACLGFHATYYKEQDGGSLSLTRDFEQLQMTAEEVAQWRAMVESDMVTLETFFQVLIDGRWFKKGFNWQEELRRLTEQREASMLDALALTNGGQTGGEQTDGGGKQSDASHEKPGDGNDGAV